MNLSVVNYGHFSKSDENLQKGVIDTASQPNIEQNTYSKVILSSGFYISHNDEITWVTWAF